MVYDELELNPVDGLANPKVSKCIRPELKTLSSWSREFDDPISTPDGGTIRTLRNAADYIQGLPNAEQHQERWNMAVEMLINAAEDRRPMMLAQIAMLQALGTKQPKPRTARGKGGKK